MNLDAVFCPVPDIHYHFHLRQEKFSITEYRKIDPNRKSVVKADSASFLNYFGHATKAYVLDWIGVLNDDL